MTTLRSGAGSGGPPPGSAGPDPRAERPLRTSRVGRLRAHLVGSWRILLKEVAAFGVIGAVAFALDLGVFTWLTQSEDLGALKSKAVSTVISTTFAYFGNRHWSFSHRARTSLGRETSFFFGINFVTLVFSEAIIALFVYGLGYGHKSTMVFVINIVTIGIGTLFRFWSYKRFVFLHPDKARGAEVTDPDLDAELAE